MSPSIHCNSTQLLITSYGGYYFFFFSIITCAYCKLAYARTYLDCSNCTRYAEPTDRPTDRTIDRWSPQQRVCVCAVALHFIHIQVMTAQPYNNYVCINDTLISIVRISFPSCNFALNLKTVLVFVVCLFVFLNRTLKFSNACVCDLNVVAPPLPISLYLPN